MCRRSLQGLVQVTAGTHAGSTASIPGLLPFPTEECMSKELVVSSNRHETRVAILEDDQLVEIYFQRQQEYSLAGSIHKPRVTRVFPALQPPFVTISPNPTAF